MSDHPLQSVQDTVRIPFYSSENIHNDLSDNIIMDQYIQNYIPQFVVDSTTQTKEQTLLKRPGIKLVPSSNFMTGIVNDVTQCTVVDAIAITALYDVFVVAVFDDSNDTFYIIMVRPAAGTFVKIGSFAPTGNIDDYIFLSEYSQSVTGSLYPAVCVSWTNKALTASKGYWAASTAGVFGNNTLTEITDTGFPPKQTPALISIGRFIPLNGTLYIASLDGRIWNSYASQNDAATWKNATSQIGSISLNAYPDQCIGLGRYKHHIVGFGKNSVEFYNDLGDTPCPLVRTDQAFIKFGAKSPRAIKNVNDVLYWVAYGSDGTVGLWQLDGYTPVKLSTPAVDLNITGTNSGGDPSSFNLQSTMIYGKPTLILNQAVGGGTPTIAAWYSGTYPTASGAVNDTYALDALNDFVSYTPCYNIIDKTWWYFTTRSSSGMGIICAGTEFSTPTVQTNINHYANVLFYQTTGSHKSQNYVYQWNNVLNVNKDEVGDSSDTDYPSRPIVTVAQMNTLWFGNEKRKRVSRAKIIGYIPANSSDANTYSMYMFYLRDQRTLTGASIPDLAVRGFNFPNSTYRYYLNNLGMGRAWSFVLVEKSKLPVTLKALELDVQQGSH